MATPNNLPIPAVAARARQNVTRKTARPTGAPPAQADRKPSRVKKPSEVNDTTIATMLTGDRNAATRGSPAPTANVTAEAMAGLDGCRR